MSTQTSDTAGTAPGTKGLKGGALGLVSSVVIGVASDAPAYSLAASLGLIVVIAGEKTPAIMLLAFVPMYLIAVAYRELNEAEPDCGTTFTWAARAFGPRTGWMGGWGIIAADIIVMANLAQIAGSYSFQLFGLDDLANDQFWSTVAGVVWILIMTYICYRGIEVSARLQYALLGIELVVLIAFAITALVKVYSGNGSDGSIVPSIAWLWPDGLSLSDFVDAILIAVFLYWGWDTAVAVNEEADDPAKTPGRAAVLSTVLLLVTYVLVAVASVAFAGTGTTGIGLGNPDNANDMFAAVGPVGLRGRPHRLGLRDPADHLGADLVGRVHADHDPAHRASCPLDGAYRAIPPRFAKIHPRYLTPSYATWAMGIVSILFYVLLTMHQHERARRLDLGYRACSSRSTTASPASPASGTTASTCTVGTCGPRACCPGWAACCYWARSSMRPTTTPSPDGGETTVFGIGGVFVIGIGSLVLGAVLMLIYSRIAPPSSAARSSRRAATTWSWSPTTPRGSACRTPTRRR